MAVFEVKVEGRAIEFYEVEATDEDDARNKWFSGRLTGTEIVEAEVVAVTLEFDEDYDPDDFEEGWFEDDTDEYVE